MSPFKTFVSGEILSASDLNASFLQVFNNGQSLGWPATGNLAMAGFELTLDSDADTSVSAVVNNIIKLKLQGANLYIFDGSVASPVNGLTFTASATGVATKITAQGTETNISIDVVPKGTGTVTIGGLTIAATIQLDADFILSNRSFGAF